MSNERACEIHMQSAEIHRQKEWEYKKVEFNFCRTSHTESFYDAYFAAYVVFQIGDLWDSISVSMLF